MDELSNMKAIIRSMLISEPTQRMTVREIARRHREEEGKPIPYVKLGFDSLEQFLKSIPDTAKFPPLLENPATIRRTKHSKFTGWGDGAILTPIINKEVSHIQSMILRQKQPKSKARSRNRFAPAASNYSRNTSRQPSFCSASDYRRPAYSFNQNQLHGDFRQQQTPPALLKLKIPSSVGQRQSQIRNSGDAGTSLSQSINWKKEEFFLPPNVEQKLLQIVRDNPGQSIQKFEASVSESYPYMAGIFPNIEDLISSLKSLDVIGGCVYLPKEIASGGYEQAVEIPKLGGGNSLAQIIPAGMELDSDDDRMFHDFRDALCSNVKDLPSSKPSAQYYDASKFKHSLTAEDAALQRLRQNKSRSQKNEERCMSDVLKKRLTELLHCYPTGIWCNMLPEVFKKYHRVELEYRESGFTNVIEMLKSCPELFICVQDSGEWKVCNSKGYWTDTENILDNIKENITQLIAEYPSGVHIDSFPKLYEKMFMRPFDHSAMRFGSIDDLFLSINNTIIKMKTEANRFIIYPLHKAEVNEVAKPVAIVTATAVHGDSGILRLIPDDCIRPDYEFPKLVMPEGIVPGKSLNLIIASVSNLDNFYALIRGNGYSESLYDLVDSMTLFYQEHKQKYRMPPELVVPGVICGTLTFGEYSRCIISSEKNSDEVAVIPIDYGCTMTVKKSGLLFLPKKFGQLPPQAIDCRCANLQPPFNEKTFKRRAATRFLELVKDKPIFAQVAQYDQQRNFLAVSLIDTTGEDDIHINDVLCSEGLASFRMDALITVKAPTIKSSLRLLDRLKQEKSVMEGRIVNNKNNSESDVPASYVAIKTTGDVNSAPVNGVVNPRLSVCDKLAALRLKADTPIPLNSDVGPVLSTGISRLSVNGLSLVSPQKSDERIVR